MVGFQKKADDAGTKKDLFAGNREMRNLFDVFAFNANPSPPAGRAYVMPGGLFFFPDLCYTEQNLSEKDDSNESRAEFSTNDHHGQGCPVGGAGASLDL